MFAFVMFVLFVSRSILIPCWVSVCMFTFVNLFSLDWSVSQSPNTHSVCPFVPVLFIVKFSKLLYSAEYR